MRLLVVSAWYPNRIHRNDGNFVARLAELMSPECSVTVVTVAPDPSVTDRDGELSIRQENGIRVVRVYYSSKHGRLSRLVNRRRAWTTGLSEAGSAFDLIHAHILIDGGIVAQRAARRLAVPFVVSEHSSRWLRDWPNSRLPEKWLARRAARAAAAILPVSEALKEGLLRHGVAGAIRVTPNAVSESIFFPPNAIDRSSFCFLHVSDFSPNKNLKLIIESFLAVREQSPEIRLRLAGDGDRDELARLVQSLHPPPGPNTTPSSVNITVSGPHPPREIADLMREADCFLLASEYETQSVVLLEAQLCGLRAIATRCGGPQSIIAHPEAGQLVDAGDAMAYRKAMVAAVLRGGDSVESRRELARQAAAKYGSEYVKAELLSLYTSLANA